MTRIVYKSLTLALETFVVAITDDIQGITDCIETFSFGHGFDQGSLRINAMYVRWKGAFAGISPGDADVSLDEHNVSAVLLLLKQRSGEDTLLVMMDDMPRYEAGSQVLDTTQAMAGVGLGIDTAPLEKQPKNLLRVTRPQTPPRAVSSKQTATASPQEPTRATPTNPDTGSVRKRTKEGKKAGRPVDNTSTGGVGSENCGEGEVVEHSTNLTSPQAQSSKHSVTPKSRQPVRRSSPSPRFPQSFHDAQREAAEKRKHRHSSGSDDNARHRQKVDDSPGAGRRDRRRDDPYGFG